MSHIKVVGFNKFLSGTSLGTSICCEFDENHTNNNLMGGARNNEATKTSG